MVRLCPEAALLPLARRENEDVWTDGALVLVGLAGAFLLSAMVWALIRLRRSGGIRLSYFHRSAGKWSDEIQSSGKASEPKT